VSDNGRTTNFIYDLEGTRTHKIPDAGGGGETVYVNQYVTVRNREIVSKHVFAGESRITTKTEWKDGNVTICWKGKTIRIGEKAAKKLLERGATLGPCDGDATKSPYDLHLFFYHGDNLGSSNYITDGDGELYQHYEYFPTGEAWVKEQSETHRTPFLFNAREFDEETGLYYFGARYYEPRQSQWISPDPFLAKESELWDVQPSQRNGGESPTNGRVDSEGRSRIPMPIDLAVYTYTRNNPVNLVDPNGELVIALLLLLLGGILAGYGIFSLFGTFYEGYVMPLERDVDRWNESGDVGDFIRWRDNAVAATQATRVLAADAWIEAIGAAFPGVSLAEKVIELIDDPSKIPMETFNYALQELVETGYTEEQADAILKSKEVVEILREKAQQNIPD